MGSHRMTQLYLSTRLTTVRCLSTSISVNDSSVGYSGSSEEGSLTLPAIYISMYIHNIEQPTFYCRDNVVAISIHDRWNLRTSDIQKVVQ